MTDSRVHRVMRAVHGFCRSAYIIGGASCMLGMMFLIAIDVGLRYLFNRPLASSHELVMFMMAIVVFTALSYSETQKGHVQIEILYSLLPKRIQRIIASLNSLLISGLFFLTAQQNVVRAQGLRTEGLRTPILHIPVYPFYIVVAFGCTVLGAVLLVSVLDSLIVKKEE